MATSELQERTKEQLRILFQACIVHENHRPDWLRNPKTGLNLELDFYLPDLEMAIEVQGKQHVEHIPFFHKDESDFRKRRTYDRFKRLKCHERAVALFEVFQFDDMEPFLEEARKRNEAVAFQLLKRNCAMKSLSYYAAEIGRHRHTNPERTEKCAARMVHIAQEYNIPLVSVRADFTIRRIQMSFFGKSIVKIHQVYESRIVDSEHAVLMHWDTPTMTCMLRWFSKEPGKQYNDLEFSLETGRQIPNGEPYWALRLETLPDWLIAKL